MLSHFLKNRAYAGVAIGLVVTLTGSIGLISGFFSSLNTNFTDSLYTRNEPSEEIIIIAIDEKSTQPQPSGLGRFSQWSRENYIKLLDALKSERPKVITFDIIFNKPTESIPLEKISVFKNNLNKKITPDEELKSYRDFLESNSNPLKNPIDQYFADKLGEFNNIVLSYVVNPNSNGDPIFPLKKFSKNATIGNSYTTLDEDGILRKAQPIFSEDSTDLATQSAMKYLNISNPQKLNLPTENGKLKVNFFASPFGYKMVSFVDLVNGKFTPGFFKDKVILVGVTSFKDNEDRVITPKSSATPMPGVEVHANEIQTILEEKFLVNQSTGSALLTIAVVSIGLAICLNYLSVWASLSVIFTVILLYIFAAHFAYKNGLLINMLYPPAAILLTYLASWMYKYFITDRKGRELKSAFGHYISGELVEQISRNPDLVKLGGEKKMVTVFFSDIKDSTAHSEKTPIEMWVSQVNEYFTVMGNVLKRSGGTLDKYEGDAVMGFWNAPVSQTDHVFRAYACAIGMRKALTGLHEKWAKEGKPLIEFRIGINTGEALVGNFGSADQFNFTVMGDTVNTASRLESAANKAYGTTTIVAGTLVPEYTSSYISQSSSKVSPGTLSESVSLANFTLRELDTVYLPGKKEPVTLFELLGLAGEATDETRNLLKIYAEGLAAYRKKDFAPALNSFASIQKTLPTFKADTPTQILLTRCQKLQAGEKIPELDEQMVFRIQNK